MCLLRYFRFLLIYFFNGFVQAEEIQRKKLRSGSNQPGQCMPLEALILNF